MADVVRLVAAVCAPALAIVARMIDSADDRSDRARLRELNQLLYETQETARVSERKKSGKEIT